MDIDCLCQKIDTSTSVDLCAQGKAFSLNQETILTPSHLYMFSLCPDPTGSMHFIKAKPVQ